MSKQFSDDPTNWAALADFAPDRGHADWRNEILSFLLYTPDPWPAPEATVTVLRPAV
jgi:hypothetical protein